MCRAGSSLSGNGYLRLQGSSQKLTATNLGRSGDHGGVNGTPPADHCVERNLPAGPGWPDDWLVPPGRRGSAMALQTIISTLLGVGVGPLVVGLFSDLLLPVYGQESLRYALMLVSLPVLGSVLLLVRTASHAARTGASLRSCPVSPLPLRRQIPPLRSGQRSKPRLSQPHLPGIQGLYRSRKSPASLRLRSFLHYGIEPSRDPQSLVRKRGYKRPVLPAYG